MIFLTQQRNISDANDKDGNDVDNNDGEVDSNYDNGDVGNNYDNGNCQSVHAYRIGIQWKMVQAQQIWSIISKNCEST
jgi:hypothetical protein